ncbi:MAG: STAS domain-containing protein [Candidatus Binatia bacterium]
MLTLSGFFVFGIGLAISLLTEESRGEETVLRITKVAENQSLVTMKLEGKIASDWVSLLERECLSVLQKKRRAVLDLSDVTFVDRGGVEMLDRMTAKGIHVINCSAPNKVD